MKNFRFSQVAILLGLLIFFACEKEDSTENEKQTFTFKYDDGTPVVGAEVSIYTSVLEKLSEAPKLSGHTDENGSITYTNVELTTAFGTETLDLLIYATKGIFSNIQSPSKFIGFEGSVWNQNSAFTLHPSYVQSIMIPTKWEFKRMSLDQVDITAIVSDCSLDNYLTAEIILSQTNVPYLSVVFNEGASVCENGGVSGAAVQAVLENSNVATVADGYELAEGTYNYPVSTYPDATGHSVDILIQSDSLYYTAGSNSGDVLMVYAPVF